jgi:hypothetical protein
MASAEKARSAVVLVLAALVGASTLFVPASGSASYRIAKGHWYTPCPASHALPDDPIVFPGQPGASHLHVFYGNVTTDAFSTPEKLLGQPATCELQADRSGYWVPQIYFNGRPLDSKPVSAKYENQFPSQGVMALPAGTTIVAGNAHAPGPQSMHVVRWNCGPAVDEWAPTMDHPYDCTPYVPLGSNGVHAQVFFPPCWNGKLSGINNTDNFAYPTKAAIHGRDSKARDPRLSHFVCPNAFPLPVARLSLDLHTGIVNPINPDGSIGLSFSSGAWYTLHADFMNAWDQPGFQRLVAFCLNNRFTKCGKLPTHRSGM